MFMILKKISYILFFSFFALYLQAEDEELPKEIQDFFELIEENDIQKVQDQLKGKSDLINIKNNEEQTPLHLARSKEMVRVLLDAGAQTKIKDKTGKTPLHLIIQRGRTDAALHLISKSNDIDIKNKYEETPLHYSADYGHFEVAKALIEKGANPKSKDFNKRTALFFVKSKEIAQLLLDAGVNPNAKDEKKQTALHTIYDPETIKMLVEKYGAKPNVKNKKGQTPLYKATILNNAEVVKALLSAGADPDIQEKYRHRTPMHQVALHDGHEEIAYSLFNAGADVQIKDRNGLTPFDLFKKSKRSENLETFFNLVVAQNLNCTYQSQKIISYNPGTQLCIGEVLCKIPMDSSSQKTIQHLAPMDVACSTISSKCPLADRCVLDNSVTQLAKISKENIGGKSSAKGIR